MQTIKEAFQIHDNIILVCNDFKPNGPLLLKGSRGCCLINNYEVVHPYVLFNEDPIIWFGLKENVNIEEIGQFLAIDNYN